MMTMFGAKAPGGGHARWVVLHWSHRPGRAFGHASLFAGLVIAALLFSACGRSGSEVAEDRLFAERLAAAVEEASTSGAGEDQLALLHRAGDEGVVTVEMARQARRAFAECAAKAGVQVSFRETTRPDGWVTWVTMVDGAGASDAERIAADCERREALWVTALYSTQPSAAQATADYLDQQASVLRACLEEAGFKPDPDATGMELAILSSRTDDQLMREAGALCLHAIGVDGF